MIEFETFSELVPINKKNILECLSRYNILDRVFFHYNNMIDKTHGFDNCGDCALEARIINNVIKEYDILVKEKSITENIGTNTEVFRAINILTGLKSFHRCKHGTLFGTD